MKTLAEKIATMPDWFKPLNDPDHGRHIHDVLEYQGYTYVIWSDSRGYSVSYMSDCGKSFGTSGLNDDLYNALAYITG